LGRGSVGLLGESEDWSEAKSGERKDPVEAHKRWRLYGDAIAGATKRVPDF
jgi:hypothetical protein